jgi:hypothetical protein
LTEMIVIDAGRPDLTDHARRVAEAELDLRRVCRARQTLARLPAAAQKSYRLVRSPNLKLLLALARRLNRRKEPSVEEFNQTAVAAVGHPMLLQLSRPRQMSSSKDTSVAQLPGASLRSAISTPRDSLRQTWTATRNSGHRIQFLALTDSKSRRVRRKTHLEKPHIGAPKVSRVRLAVNCRAGRDRTRLTVSKDFDRWAQLRTLPKFKRGRQRLDADGGPP